MSDCGRHAFDVPELPGCPFCGGVARIRWYCDGTFSLDVLHEKGCIMLEDLEGGIFDPGDFDSMIAAWCARAERTCRDETSDARFCSTCSECGHVRRSMHGWNKAGNGPENGIRYCPDCGARVRG